MNSIAYVFGPALRLAEWQLGAHQWHANFTLPEGSNAASIVVTQTIQADNDSMSRSAEFSQVPGLASFDFRREYQGTQREGEPYISQLAAKGLEHCSGRI